MASLRYSFIVEEAKVGAIRLSAERR